MRTRLGDLPRTRLAVQLLQVSIGGRDSGESGATRAENDYFKGAIDSL